MSSNPMSAFDPKADIRNGWSIRWQSIRHADITFECQASAHAGDLAMKPKTKMKQKTKKKPKTKKRIRRIVTLIHRIAISLHAEAETLQQKTASLIAELDRKKPKRPVRTKLTGRARRKIH
jgi:hypothetical protein